MWICPSIRFLSFLLSCHSPGACIELVFPAPPSRRPYVSPPPKAMMLDTKLNKMQHSEGELKKLVEAYRFWGPTCSSAQKHDFWTDKKPPKKLLSCRWVGAGRCRCVLHGYQYWVGWKVSSNGWMARTTGQSQGNVVYLMMAECPTLGRRPRR